MEPENLKRAIRVGLFITIGLIILVTGILTLGSLQKTFVKNIHLQAIFSDVSGLKKGNSIWFSGVKVGTISNIRFSGTSRVVVQMNVEQSVSQYIHKDATVKLSSDGLIGNKLIEINGGNPKLPTAEDGDILQVANTVSTDEMMKNLELNNENLITITGNLKKVSAEMARGKGVLGSIVSDTSLDKEFKTIFRNLNQTSLQTLELAKNTNRFSTGLNQKNGLASKLINDTTVFHQLSSSVKELNQITAAAHTLLIQLNKSSEQLNTNKGPLGLLLNDEKEAARLRNTLYNLNQSSIKLNEDLEAAQHNFLLKGFFKNKNKNNAGKSDSLPSNP